jgi:hypothetical protein
MSASAASEPNPVTALTTVDTNRAPARQIAGGLSRLLEVARG